MKCKIRVSLPFLILVCALFVLDKNGVLFYTLLAAALHEAAHILAIKCCGGTLEKIEIRAFGVRIEVPELALMPYKKEIIIAAAGPLAGLLCAFICIAAARLFNFPPPSYFIGINIVIAAINLIPVYPLDGGRIALSAFLLLFGERAGYTAAHVLAIFAVASMFSLCVICALNNSLNPTLAIFSVYIAVCSVTRRA